MYVHVHVLAYSGCGCRLQTTTIVLRFWNVKHTMGQDFPTKLKPFPRQYTNPTMYIHTHTPLPGSAAVITLWNLYRYVTCRISLSETKFLLGSVIKKGNLNLATIVHMQFPVGDDFYVSKLGTSGWWLSAFCLLQHRIEPSLSIDWYRVSYHVISEISYTTHLTLAAMLSHGAPHKSNRMFPNTRAHDKEYF